MPPWVVVQKMQLFLRFHTSVYYNKDDKHNYYAISVSQQNLAHRWEQAVE